MSKPKDDGGIETSSREIPALGGIGTLIFEALARSNQKFTRVKLEGVEKPKRIPSRPFVSLEYQGFSELSPDSSLGLIWDVLKKAGLQKIDERHLSRQIRDRISASAWRRVRRAKRILFNEEVRNSTYEVYILAIWAELYEEKLSATWLAAMAKHAYYIERDDHAFGYLSAQLRQKVENEREFLIGNAVKKGGRRGGTATGENSLFETNAVLNAMKDLIGEHTIREAAALVHQRGLGSSPEANRKLWARKQKMCGTSAPDVPS